MVKEITCPFYFHNICRYIDILISKRRLPHVTLTYQILLRIFKNSGKFTAVQIKRSKNLIQAAVVPI